MTQTQRRAQRRFMQTSRVPEGPATDDLEALDAVLTELAELAQTEGIGQSIEFRPTDAAGAPDIDEAFVVDIDPDSGRWAVAYDNSRTGVGVISLADSDDDSEVELQWAGEWESTEARCFIDADVARRAVLQYFRDGSLAEDVHWVQA
jgi:hypothetical protein